MLNAWNESPEEQTLVQTLVSCLKNGNFRTSIGLTCEPESFIHR